MRKQHILAAFAMSPWGLAASAQSVDTPARVLTHVAAPAEAMTERRFFGRVVARETVDLGFDIGGRVEYMTVEAGDRVAGGAVLARMRLASLTRAVERARITLDAAKRERQRAEALVESNATARTRAEDAADAVALAKVALGDAEQALADATLFAPFDALVVERLVPPLSVVEPGQPVLRLHDLSELRIEVVLPERLLADVADPGALLFKALLPGITDPVSLSLRTFRAEADRIGQGYTVTLALPPDASSTLVPGIAAEVLVTRPVAAPGVPIPSAAVVVGPKGETSVLSVTGPEDASILRSIPVSLHSTDGRFVLAEGITPGTEIIAAGTHLLADGQRVTPLVRLRPEVQ
jgi:RND family efflux transporter MFP subunit